MAGRRSLQLPITLGVVMIVLVVALTIGWVLLAVFGALQRQELAPLYWTLLAVGTVVLGLILLGVVIYLVLSIKAINLNRRQSNFIDSVTHELKSPIASLKLYLQTLNRRRVSDEERDRFCRYMLVDVERLDELINHLLNAARLERRTVAAEVEDVDLGELLHQCSLAVCQRYHVAEESVHFETEPTTVRGARRDVDMIFRNLIDNAVKYAGNPPKVSIHSRVNDDGFTVTRIEDNGAGIPRKLRRKIFGRFIRLGLELEREKPGTGLGLYIVRTLVAQMRGSVKVHDAATESGTVFEVRLPGRSALNDPDAAAGPKKTEAAEVA
jgi:two-component system phosphate regulon sensor histidine kinase PhoR